MKYKNTGKFVNLNLCLVLFSKCISQHVIGSHIRYDNAGVNSARCTIYLTWGFELSTKLCVLKSQFLSVLFWKPVRVIIYYFSKHLPKSLTVKTDCFVKLSVYIVYLYLFVISAILTHHIGE